MDDIVERVFEYLCSYAADFTQPATEDEITRDLNLMPIEVSQVLTLLQDDGRVFPHSTMPRAVLFSSDDVPQPPAV